MQFLFQQDGIAWKLLREDPDRYIYEPVLKGIDLQLPEDIEAGINDVSKRDGWNKPAREEYALSTETWREHVARRQRCLELRQKIADGEINSANDLITYNLNMRQLAHDVIENCYDPELVWAFYQAITKITVLDPTCGSGAFLFSALNILEPLYEACLDQMQIFLDEGFVPANENAAQVMENFRNVIEQVELHHNRHYFILKTIIINNLYGVDIMQEATEICKLRLYLKLASKIEPNYSKPNNGIEPLPDIDFNIRAGNTLVGFASYEEVKKAVKGEGGETKLDLFDDMARIDQKAQAVDQIFQKFRALQTQSKFDGEAIATKKTELRSSLDELRNELDRYLADEHEWEQSKKTNQFNKWKESHQPFHWFVEFYGIIKQGGFDVIIGNPPYVEYKDVKTDYQLFNYITTTCSNLFAYILEKCTFLSHQKSYVGMIIPLSAFSTDRMKPLIHHIQKTSLELYLSNFSWRPGKLFDGVNLQLTIVIQKIGYINNKVYTSQYILWESEARSELFSKIEFISSNDNRLTGSIPKLGNRKGVSVLNKLRNEKSELGSYFTKKSDNIIFYRRGGLYWKVFVDFPTESSEEKIIYLSENIDKYLVIAVLSSNLWFWYFTITSDCRHLGNRDINTFPLDIKNLSNKIYQKLSHLGKNYVNKLNAENTVRVYKGKKAVKCLSFRVNQSKTIIDEIDRVLAQHYGFTNEELDFIINYDIKYRMGKHSDDDSE